MKHFSLSLFFLFILFTQVQAQKTASGCAYTDAIAIKTAMNAKDTLSVETILRYYFPDSVGELRSQLNPNDPHQQLLSAFLGSVKRGAPGFSALAESQAGQSVLGAGDAINALGTFIADRFKQEINIAFLTKFRDDLNTQPLIGTLLPLTKMVMQQSDPYNYTSFMETLQEAFDSDMHNLPLNLSKAIQSGEIPIKNQQAKYYTFIGLGLSASILKNPTDPLAALSTLYQSNYLDSLKPEAKKSLLALNFAVNALKVKSPNQVFMSSGDMKLLQRNDSLFHIYAALLIKQNEPIFRITNTENLVSILTDLSVITDQFNQQYMDLKTAYAGNRVKPEQVIAYYKYFLSCTRSLFAFVKNDLNQPYNPELNVVLNKLDTIGIIADYVNGKKYGLACLYSIELMQSTLNNIPPQLGQYLNFAANMLQAESSDDMVAALQNAAMPVGSYRIKRNSTFDVSLNAYAGGFFGYNAKNEDGLYGFTAPVGLYFGWGNLWDGIKNTAKTNDKGKSLGFFLPIVDVGAVTSFRLANGSSQMAEISWSNVFAPGAYLSFGAGKCPVSINLGGQYGPQLRSIDAIGAPVLINKEWYWRLSVLIDIPIFDFYTKQHTHNVSSK